MYTAGKAFLLLIFAPLISSLPAEFFNSGSASQRVNSTSVLVARAPPEFPWIAMGDSFSAGPGAGDPFGDDPDGGCLRNKGAYAPQLNDDFPYPVSALQFVSCTGAVVDDLVEKQIPLMDEDQRFVTLSIGGNDLGFTRVLRACVFQPGASESEDCDTVLDEVKKSIQDNYRATLRKAWDAVFGKLLDDDKRQVVVVFYPSFFNEDTDWCNEQSISVVPFFPGAKLTRALRQKLNDLAALVQLYTIKVGQAYVAEKESRGDWSRNRLFAIDAFDDEVYPGHRFCEPGVETLDNEDIHFFIPRGNDSPVTVQELLNDHDPNTCADDPRFKTDPVFGWYCDTVRYAATLPAGGNNLTTVLPETILKAFHPKTAAFTTIKDIHKGYVSRYVFPPEVNTDLGNLQCQPTRTAGDALWFASRDDLLQAMNEFCDSTAAAGINPGLIEGIYNNLHVSAKMEGDATSCPAIDVTSDGFTDLCKSRLINAIDGCDIENKDPNGQLWKQGGSFFRDCITWYIGVQASDADSSSIDTECKGRVLDFAHVDKCGLDLPTFPA